MARMTLDQLDQFASTRLQEIGRSNQALIGLKIEVQSFIPQIEVAAERAAIENYRHAAGAIRKDAQASIIPDPLGKPAAPGRPVHTRRGQVKRSIVYAADKFGAVIGPTARIVGVAMKSHEFGGDRPDTPTVEHYPARPVMGPALKRQTDRFAGRWLGSIGA
jgi:hypothetical protein